MQRDMSSPLDASMSTRNQGQLISEETVITHASRTPGLQELPAVAHTSHQRIPGTGMGKVMRGQGYGQPQGLAEFSLNVPYLGTLDMKTLAVGVLFGAILYKFTGGARAKMKAKLSRAKRELAA